MKFNFSFKSVRTRLMFWFLVVALLPLMTVSVIIYNQRVHYIKQEAFGKLQAIRDLKAKSVNYWLDEKLEDIQTFRKLSVFTHPGQGQDSPGRSEGGVSIRGLASALNTFQDNYKDFDDIFFVNARSGIISIATKKSLEGKDLSNPIYVTEPLRTGEIYISPIYHSKAQGKATMEISIPIGGNGKVKSHTGVLVFRINLEHSLYELLLDRTGLGNTGETLIVDKDGIALNELRWYNKAPLKLKIETHAARLAAQGKTGIAETIDYRGEPILAAYTHIPRTNWGFVAKMDLKEVYGPINDLLLNIFILFSVSAIAVVILSAMLARKITRPILSLAATAVKLQSGDLSARNDIRSRDEIGYLAQSFNQAAEATAGRIILEKKTAEVTESLIHSTNLTPFAQAVLEKFTEATESAMGAFYFRIAGDIRFTPLTSTGMNPELLETFDASIFEGEFGKAVKTRQITHLQNISEETIFKFKTFAGTATPREIITIPLSVNHEVRGMISLAGLKAYSKESLGILNQTVIVALNTAFSNLLANEETQRLAEELRDINQELQAQQEELEAQSEELVKQTEELQQQNTELEQQRYAVEESNRLKSEFLSNMSHELRTPLNSVMALSRVLMMQAGGKLSEEEVNYLGIIERNGKNLLALINDILDLAKIEAGRMEVNPKPLSLHRILENIIERLEPIAAEKHIEIRKNIPEGLLQIESDESRVSQILQNLVANAVKFTETGHVTLSVTSGTDRISVHVTDTGIGISAKYLPYIFDEFRQIDGSASRRHEGTGLGLAISRKAAKMIGGDISVKSAPGEGSTFTLTLPLTWRKPLPGLEQAVNPRRTEPASGQKTVLIVDDEPEMADLISRCLVQEGYRTLTAASGTEALRLAAAERPFAITLDIIMPDMDGWEVLQSLKKNPETKGIPVIVVSVTDNKETGFALGAVGYVSKPVSGDALIAEIKKIGKPQKHTIMVVDDDEADRTAIKRIIEEEGLKAVAAENGVACLEMIKEHVPDVLVLDLVMPEMDGFAVLDHLRSDAGTANLPVIIVTAKDLTRQDKKKLRGNVFSILEKSAMRREALLESIKNILVDLENKPGHAGRNNSGSCPRILLVEDNEVAIIQIRTVLEAEGFIADVAKGGQEALDYVSRTIPDGIILDLMMPEIDGFEVLEKIRGTEMTAHIPVLILTAKDLTPDDLKRLSANHVQQLVQKGDVDKEMLIFKIRAMLGPATVSVGEPLGQTEFVTAPKAVRGPRTGGKKDKTGRASILIVEDNPDNMTTIKAILQNRYIILEAADGEQGFKMAETNKPDLILLDMALPKMDGLTVTRRLKSKHELAHIPVIAMTARVMKGDRERIIAAGCDAYVSKPVDPQGVLQIIEEWLT